MLKNLCLSWLVFRSGFWTNWSYFPTLLMYLPCLIRLIFCHLIILDYKEIKMILINIDVHCNKFFHIVLAVQILGWFLLEWVFGLEIIHTIWHHCQQDTLVLILKPSKHYKKNLIYHRNMTKSTLQWGKLQNTVLNWQKYHKCDWCNLHISETRQKQ